MGADRARRKGVAVALADNNGGMDCEPIRQQDHPGGKRRKRSRRARHERRREDRSGLSGHELAHGGEQPEERTDWHRVNLWGRLAQVAEDYVSKGDKLYVEGYLQYDSYERDGITIPTAEIRAREMIMLTPKAED